MFNAQITARLLVLSLMLAACGPIAPHADEPPEESGESREAPEAASAATPRITVGIDANLSSARVPLPVFADGQPRPLSVAGDGRGKPAEFVSNELIVVAHNSAALEAFIARHNGVVLQTANPAVLDSTASVQTLVRIDATGADLSRLSDDLAHVADEGVAGDFVVSDDAGRDLIAVAAYEAREHGMLVGINWVASRDGFVDRSLSEAPTGFSSNPFDWKHLAAGTTQDIGVTEAWRALAIAGKLDNRVKIAVLDGGFAPNADFPAGTESISMIAGDAATGSPNPNSCGSGSCPWHGTNVAAVVAGRVDNSFGTAGTAGPVADLLTIHQSVDYFSATLAVITAAANGADIINMSFSARVPAFVSWTVEPFNVTTAITRATGVLLFASAGNAGEDVDAEDCFGVCWEEAWHTPCENAGVECVGGLKWDSRSKAGGSNYGHEEVDIYAPYTVVVGVDPDNTANMTRTGSGTSYSSPFTAGVAALIWAADPSLPAGQVIQIMRQTAHSSSDPKVNRYVDAYRAVKHVLGNLPPTLEIVAPKTGQTISGGAFNDVTLVAATEDEAGVNAVDITWTSDLDGALGYGHTRTVSFSPGKRTITATATDSQGATATASIVLNVSNTPPKVYIVSPAEGAVVYTNTTVKLQGDSFDPEAFSALPCDDLTWTDITTSTPLGTGCDPAVVFTTTGFHIIQLAGTDGTSQATATRTITVAPKPNTGPPIATILSPNDGDGLNPNSLLFLKGEVEDPDGGKVKTQWTIQKKYGGEEIELGSGLNVPWVPAQDVGFNCGGVTLTLRLYATDEGNATAVDSISIWIAYPPC